MRPAVLNPLFASLSSLPGIGPKVEKLYARLLNRDNGPPRLIDLLFHLPTSFVDRRNQPKLSEVTPDTVVTVAVTIDKHRPSPPHRPRAPYNIAASDDTNTLTITYFNARKDYLQKHYPVGEVRYVSGTATLYDGHLQMVHPDHVVDAEGFKHLPLLDPVYPRHCGGCTTRNRPRIFRPKARRGRGSPTMNFSPASSRSLSFACICASAAAVAALPKDDRAAASSPRSPMRSRHRSSAR